MGAEHERYLTEVVFQKPVIVYNYPKAFKVFASCTCRTSLVVHSHEFHYECFVNLSKSILLYAALYEFAKACLLNHFNCL